MSSDEPSTKNNRPNCFKCKHLFITFLPSKPYGCRILKFRSKKIPSIVVYESSGIYCQLFTPKDGGEDDGSNDSGGHWIA